MLEVLGPEYLIEHCIAEHNRQKRFESFEIYVTDCLSTIAKSVGAKVSRRFYDILNPPKAETKKPEEIVDDIVARCGLKVVRKSNGIYEPDGVDRG